LGSQSMKTFLLFIFFCSVSCSEVLYANPRTGKIYTAKNFIATDTAFLKGHPKLLEFQQIMWAINVFKDLQYRDIYEIIAAGNILNKYLGEQKQMKMAQLFDNPIPLDE